MKTSPTRPFFDFVEYACAWCRHNPCECRPLARTSCVCGALLEAADDLESKRRAAAEHTRSGRHLAWRLR
jgi:hypothetical protein